MSLFRIALRSILQRGVASLLTVLSMALGVMLVVAVLSIHGVVSQSFHNNASLGYNVIVGPKGGKEQLVLNSVYYLSQPVENIPYTYYLEFLQREERDRLLLQSYAAEGTAALKETAELLSFDGGSSWAVTARDLTIDRLGLQMLPDMNLANFPPVEFGRHGKYGQMTQLAIPLCLGDYYSRFRVVGTTPALFDDLVYDIENNRKFEFAQGRNFQWRSEEHGFFEAVVGSTVAREITLSEVHISLGKSLDQAIIRFVAEHANWSRIEARNTTLVLTFDLGASEGEFFRSLDRLLTKVLDGIVELPPEDEWALFALLAPQALTRKTTRHLTVGDAISPRHGDPEGHTHARKFTVVGILKPSGTPNDRAVFVNMEGFYLMEDHAKPVEKAKAEEGKKKAQTEEEWKAEKAQQLAERKKQLEIERAADPDPLPVEQREVTAILVKVDPMIAIGMENGINEGSQAQAVLPVSVIYGLFEFIITPIQWTLLLLTAMICVVASISILVSIYNSMSERRGEIAVMRALGAGRGTVMTIILLEATLLALAGGALGWLAGHTGVLAISPWIEEKTGVQIGFYSWEPAFRILNWLGFSGSAAERITLPVELVLLPALVLLAIVVGIWPALSAYRTDVAKSLGK